ncbi:MAG: DUF5011 domain-containing protein [Candidatus Hydrogenedens sp.]|nr:DUF5011 domain-containing protein [Candidatus Hydrogenedens sp.]
MMPRNTAYRFAALALLLTQGAWGETLTYDYEGGLLQPGDSISVSIDARIADPLPTGYEAVESSAVVETTEGPVESPAARTPVGPDVQAPTLELLGNAEVVIECGSAFNDPGATAQDDRDGDISGSIAASEPADTGTPGEYTITYTAADAAGNTASRSRLVLVRDTVPPVLTIDGGNSVSICAGNAFTAPAATATDICAGDLTESIEQTGTVDIYTTGFYTLTYAVSDGTNTTQAVLQVSVVSGGDCPQQCEVRRVDLITDADTFVFPPTAASRPVVLSARVKLLPENLCVGASPEVWFDVDGTRFDAEFDAETGLYTVELDFDPGAYPVAALASLDNFPAVSSEARTITVENAQPSGAAGLPASPAGALALPGDRWQSDESSAGCPRATAGVHLTSDNVRTAPPLVLELPPPFDGTITVTWPASIVKPGESFWLYASAACSPEALFFPSSAGAAATALPDALDGTWPFVLLQAVAMNGDALDIDAGDRFAQSPPTVVLEGFGTQTTKREARGFGADWADSGSALRVTPGTGPWNVLYASPAVAPLGALAYSVRVPGVFAIFESIDLAELTVTPGGSEALYGVVPLGESKEIAFELSNTGGQALAGRAFLDDATGAFTLLDTATYTLQPAGQTTVRVRFTAIGTDEFSAKLRLTGAPSGTREITLRANVSVPDDKPNRILGCGAGDGLPGGRGGDLAVVGVALILLLGLRARQRGQRD